MKWGEGRVECEQCQSSSLRQVTQNTTVIKLLQATHARYHHQHKNSLHKDHFGFLYILPLSKASDYFPCGAFSACKKAYLPKL